MNNAREMTIGTHFYLFLFHKISERLLDFEKQTNTVWMIEKPGSLLTKKHKAGELDNNVESYFAVQ